MLHRSIYYVRDRGQTDGYRGEVSEKRWGEDTSSVGQRRVACPTANRKLGVGLCWAAVLRQNRLVKMTRNTKDRAWTAFRNL